MFKYAELFIEHLQKVNPAKVNFKVSIGVDDEGNETLVRVEIPYSATHITASFFGDENGSNFAASMAMGVIDPNCVDLVAQDVIALCNEFNNNNQWVKFCVRDSSSVPGLNGALICLEESTVLVEKTAAQDAYSIVSNLIKALSESAEPFKKILTGRPEKKEEEKADNKPLTKFYIGITQVSREDICEIESLLKQNEKIKAINLVRNLSGLGLKEAKAFIDNYSSYNLNAPHLISTKENPKNITDEKLTKNTEKAEKRKYNNLTMWFPVILSCVGVVGGTVFSMQERILLYVFFGYILNGCGLGLFYKRKVDIRDKFLRQGQANGWLLLEQRKKEKLPTALIWILFILGMISFSILCLRF